MLLIFLIILGLAAANASIAAAQQMRFSARGVVTAIDPNALTMTVQLDRTSRLLKNYRGGMFDFVLSGKTQVVDMGNGGMGNNARNPDVGMMGPGPGPGNPGHNGKHKMSLSDVQVNDDIQLMGHENRTSGSFVVTGIQVWLN